MANSDELISLKATTDEEKGPKPKSVEFDVVDMSNPVLENRIMFADVYQFREAVREYNLKIRKDLSFVKNDKDKVIIVCKDEHCNYRVHGSKVKDEMTFQIKTYNPNHTCTRAYKNSQITSRWIAERYMETFRHDIKNLLLHCSNRSRVNGMLMLAGCKSIGQEKVLLKTFKGVIRNNTEKFGIIVRL